MAFFIFIDESGIDGTSNNNYEVLCGASIEDRDLWSLISALKNLEEKILGVRYSNQEREIKGRKFLNKSTFKQASWFNDIADEERTALCKKCLLHGEFASRREISGMAQAKLAYVKNLLQICSQFRVKIFATLCIDSVRSTDTGSGVLLRRDYVFLFERIYYFLEDKKQGDQGVIVFDELEKSQSHILVGQLEGYFKKTIKGKQWANLVIPEPFFVHSDLTTGIQIADMIAYILSFGLRLNYMTNPARPELQEFVNLILPLRYSTERELDGVPNMKVWSVTYVK
jgi:hypothetical protein